MAARIVTWNLEWATPRSNTERRIRSLIESLNADVLVLTEASLETVPENGYVIAAEGSWGYEPRSPSMRKVFMWSKEPWANVTSTGPDLMPGGRFVTGATRTPDGVINVMGVCIPWKDAHVRTGLRNRSPWEDHRTYIESLQPLLASAKSPFVVAGDFNQKIPRKTAPRDVAELLLTAFGDTNIVTESSGDAALIDHVALSGDLVGELSQVLPRADGEGKLSDHLGAVVDFGFGTLATDKSNGSQ